MVGPSPSAAPASTLPVCPSSPPGGRGRITVEPPPATTATHRNSQLPNHHLPTSATQPRRLPCASQEAQLAIAQWKRAHSGDSGAGQA
ncbi:hypothetical protein HaLaN_20711, partial [Haematococcus lacustris]